MRASSRSRFIELVRAQWAGLLALFLVLAGGTAYAANTIGSSDIINESILSQDLKNGQVTVADIATNAVGSVEIANGQVTRSDLVPPEPWHVVGPGSASVNRCNNAANTAVFCSDPHPLGEGAIPWHNFGGGYATAAFYKDQLGIVHLRGLVVAGVEDITSAPNLKGIFRLPVAYRPASNRVFSSVGPDEIHEWEVAPGRVDVNADGMVTFVEDCSSDVGLCSTAAADHLSLEGISFRPD